jgi:hypothetical protein
MGLSSSWSCITLEIYFIAGGVYYGFNTKLAELIVIVVTMMTIPIVTTMMSTTIISVIRRSVPVIPPWVTMRIYSTTL